MGYSFRWAEPEAASGRFNARPNENENRQPL
ncbi:hypothetical protein AvCA_40920 [Azotobacter vinelandii CA]|uniref:Uncharacterized protein n=2 Tax=Azotobacter vinelandii TaxID=354 RepID=C1DEB9_AZOVD|nr:hypothetical protein Avin_40920 [Azotobacter vinelandii DJ]AGK14450.1 hypothetical protein AvCA_40920 [Azotobacter vinelandii CA]AGK21782.1 hypothetical protein AvCA6_40920 [Azotobacter vinelandii CA6]